uniref:Putative secreted protein n=1 Tax=Anopheles darlingi TaxID=43151 RepID=A0A2M4D861_ANODA
MFFCSFPYVLLPPSMCVCVFLVLARSNTYYFAFVQRSKQANTSLQDSVLHQLRHSVVLYLFDQSPVAN